jgi:hypothetical protein
MSRKPWMATGAAGLVLPCASITTPAHAVPQGVPAGGSPAMRSPFPATAPASVPDQVIVRFRRGTDVSERGSPRGH